MSIVFVLANNDPKLTESLLAPLNRQTVRYTCFAMIYHVRTINTASNMMPTKAQNYLDYL